MKPFIVKHSISRKRLHNITSRQKKNIISEIRNNLHTNYSQNCKKQSNTVNNIQDDSFLASGPSHIECSFTANLENNIYSNNNNIYINTQDNRCDYNSLSSDIDTFSFSHTSSIESSFQEKLASCFIDNNLTHVQGNSILSLLRSHSCFRDLPKDVRTLLNTPRVKIIVSKVEPGEYIHFDMEASIIEVLSCFSIDFLPNQIDIDFHTDGCNLDKSGNVHFWPIQCRLSNIKHVKPIIIGIYKGTAKPYNPNLFFEKFIADIKRILANGGIIFKRNKLPIRLRCFIADAPARAFILNHKGHISCQPCSKCKISGIRYEGRYIFCGTNHSLRTDEEYVKGLDEDHHKNGTSPLSMLPIGMVSQVPFDYMHLVCLGVMKKILSAWVCGKYSHFSKLPARSISIISSRLETLAAYCPSDFARRPKSLNMCTKYKATEFRQFLLYTGPVVTYGIFDKHMYMHFLFLHAAIRILVSPSLSKTYLNFADLALKKFVDRCNNFYGPTFYSYNIHGLLHLAYDVQQLGPLDTFSAFPYENNMRIFRKYCRKPGLPLQQISNRFAEIKNHGTTEPHKIESSIHATMKHNAGPLPCNLTSNCVQYRKIIFNKILLTLDIRDNCCILHNGSVCIVINIFMTENLYYLAVKKFMDVDKFYNVGITSLALQIFKCSSISNDVSFVRINEVHRKCYKMPFWDCTSIESSSDEENHPQNERYIIAAIIHNE